MTLPRGAPWATPSREPCIQSSTLSNVTSHLQSFSGLRVFKIVGWDTSAVQATSLLRYFGPHFESVIRSTLERILIPPSAFVTFVSHFPHLSYLSISALKRPWGAGSTEDLDHEPHGSIVPTHPCGEFRVSDASRISELKNVLEGIVLLEPRFRRVALRYVRYEQWRYFWPLVEVCAVSLEHLELLAISIDADCDGLSLACCPNLRTISFDAFTDHYYPPPSCEFVKKCLSTITSTQLPQVTLEVFGNENRHDPGPPGTELSPTWDSLDIILYNLAGQYRPRHEGGKMLVNYESKNLRDTGNYLWRFRERGILWHQEY